MVINMKKKYIFTLILIGFLLVITLTIGTGYGVWLATREKEMKTAQTLDCFKVYFSASENISMDNIKPVLKEEGIETSPNTITITNICDEEKEVEVRLSVLASSTMDTNSLTINATGYIEKETMLYKNLDRAKTKDEEVAESKIIGKINVKPNETVRTNIKIWFDEKKAPNVTPEDTFNAKYEIIDSAKSIKATFAETLIGNKQEEINNKAKPNYATPSVTNDGLYQMNEGNGVSYYYRGIETNNYVSFANLIWRIIKINSDNSIKIILDKPATTMYFSENNEYADYTGLRYIYSKNTVDNNVTEYLNDWYKTNITAKGMDSYVKVTTFCNDSSSTKDGRKTIFGGYTRLVTKKEPSLVCPTTNNDFGGTYVQKVGLITADEVSLAGGVYQIDNMNYYLYNGTPFLTMTPADYIPYGYVLRSEIFMVNENGSLEITPTTTELGIRPVISLDPSLTVSGKGTLEDPYTIDLDE